MIMESLQRRELSGSLFFHVNRILGGSNMDIIKKAIDSMKLSETKRVFNTEEMQVGDLIKVHKLGLEKGAFDTLTLDVHESYMKGIITFAAPDSIKITSYVQLDDEASVVRITIDEVYTPDVPVQLSLGMSEFSASIIPFLEEKGMLYVLEVV